MKGLCRVMSIAACIAVSLYCIPASGSSAGAKKYARDMAPISHSLCEAMDLFNTNSVRAVNDPSVMATNDWKIYQAGACAEFRLVAEGIERIHPPQVAASVHATMRKVARHLRLFVNLYIHGIDRLDASEINASTRQMNIVTALLQHAKTQLAQIAN